MKRFNKVLPIAIAATGAAAVTAAAAYCAWQNNDVVVTKLTYHNVKVPEAFHGFRIVQLSDVHCKKSGIKHAKLLMLLKKEKPGLIAVTGDLIDRHQTNVEAAMQFMHAVARIAPVYFVPGNHEARCQDDYHLLREMLRIENIVVLENAKEVLYRDGAAIQLLGVKDPAFTTFSRDKKLNACTMQQNLSSIADLDTSTLHILLSHRPELAEVYQQLGMDLVLSGHAHGGQWRIPGIGGLFSPHQGMLPKYTSGMHTFGNTTVIVSRGLGNSAFPIRIANRPEMISITLSNRMQGDA